MNTIKIFWKIVTDKNFRNMVLYILEIAKNANIQEFTFVDQENQVSNLLSKEIEICKTDIDTLGNVLEHIKKYDSENVKLISDVNNILNDLKQYYRSIE